MKRLIAVFLVAIGNPDVVPKRRENLHRSDAVCLGSIRHTAYIDYVSILSAFLPRVFLCLVLKNGDKRCLKK